MHLCVSELPYPCLWFSLVFIIYPLNGGFSEALNLPESIKTLSLWCISCPFSISHKKACGAFSAQSGGGGLVGAVLYSAWRKARVRLASIHGRIPLIFKESTPTALLALITTKTKESCCFIAFQPGLNPYEAAFSHPYFELLGGRKKNISLPLVYMLVYSLYLNMSFGIL